MRVINFITDMGWACLSLALVDLCFFIRLKRKNEVRMKKLLDITEAELEKTLEARMDDEEASNESK